MRRNLLLAAATLLAATLVPFSASAAPKALKATGSVGLEGGGYIQYASFNAFDYGVTGDRGNITYTNFDYDTDTVGSGVWDVRGTYPVLFGASGEYAHTVTIDTITPTSPSSYSFSGTGVYDADTSYTWTITGTVNGTAVVFDIVYTGTGAGYTAHGTGTIAPDGSISGTATDSNAVVLPFATLAGAAHEVLSFTADVTCAQVSATSANFLYTVPGSFDGLSGTPVLVTVTDGGSPGTFDTWKHDGTPSSTTCATAATTNYPIVSGNLVVHKS